MRALKHIETFFTAFGASLPVATRDHRGQFAWKRTSGSEDEINAGVVDSSGVAQWRRILTKTYADTLYSPPLTVQVGDVTVDTSVTTLDFGEMFTITESPEDEINIDANFGTLASTIAEGNHTHSEYVSATLVQSGSSSPENVVTANPGTLYLLTTADNGNQLYVKTSGTGNDGWLPQEKAARRRSIREVISYEGASTSSSFVAKGFQNGPTVTASSTGNADASTGWWLSHSTTSSSGNVASVVAGSNSGVQSRWAPDLAVAFRTGSPVTSVRYWIGLFASTPAASDDPTIEGIGFRFSTNASDSNWQAWSNDGSGGGTVTDTGVAIGGAGTAFDLRFICDSDGTTVDFYISSVWVARHTTNLPTSTTVLNYGLYVTALSASSRALRWGRITLESEP